MLYRAIGLMSGSSLDGLDIAFVELLHTAGDWSYEIIAADCYPYSAAWKNKLQHATALDALSYQLLHAEYGHYLGREVLRFITEKNLHYQVALIASHGHTTFHVPKIMTAQLGDGAALAAETGLPVVSDLRAMDVAFGGQGAPIVPIGEKLLLKDFDLYLNLGGIANISFNKGAGYAAYDICAANRVLNMIIAKEGKDYDAGGALAATGFVHEGLLQQLAGLPYYQLPYPKSLANNFGVEEVYPMITAFGLSAPDALRTYVEHIVQQISRAIREAGFESKQAKLLVTGGGAFNSFLISQLREEVDAVEIIIPDDNLIQYKEALIMALMGVLRWRQEYNTLPSVTGATRNSIGGAVYIGQEA